MPETIQIDLREVAHATGLPADRVHAVVDLLEAGNTVPFITRYRKDQTGGLDEEQIRAVESRVLRLRLLAERKQTILRSIESQGKLTPELSAAIRSAETTKQLEDLYLPFKPKKQTLATAARGRGLEPLAQEILAAAASAHDLDQRAADFVNPDKQVFNIADALLGAGHIIAEGFGERADFRERVRSILSATGMLITTAAEPEERPELPAASVAAPTTSAAVDSTDSPDLAEAASPPAASEAPQADPIPTAAEAPLPPLVKAEGLQSPEVEPADTPADPPDQAVVADEPIPPGEVPTQAAPAGPPAPTARQLRAQQRAERKKKKQQLQQLRAERERKAFRDFFNYRERLSQAPPHRVLAINRGERAKVLRVRVEADLEAMFAAVDELLAPEGHPHREFLRGCGRDALTRLVLPSLEREVRRELTDNAEAHAVKVFARNLRQLLLQPPVRDRRILAIDPGYKSGCKLAVVDEFGNALDQGLIYLVGKEERREEAKAKIVDLIRKHQVQAVAIGNGTACRETEKLIAGLIETELAPDNVSYVIVNEAGASVYSTSRLGREELPNYDATVRSAVSIGRRLEDPLSELVKIEPASIGVGLYQHDVKAKHLRTSVDAVVESCVNFVGVDVNTASPSLLRYVSGLNQLTAQRVYEYRCANGPFRNREQLKEVSGLGEATFVQAAGFLKIVGGDEPLDGSWIHPESYPVARRVLERLSASTADLSDKAKAAAIAEQAGQLDVAALAEELQAGQLSLADIVSQLGRPGRDPRESLPPPVFKRGILKFTDLAAGMELSGTVLNVVDFGAFVDIGLKDSGLVHISQLSDRFVPDPHEVVSVGDIVKVWVLSVDQERRRVALTMIQPGTRRASERREPRPRPQRRPPRQGVAPAVPPSPDGAPAVVPAPAGGEVRPERRPPRPPARTGGAQRPAAARQEGAPADRPPPRGGRGRGPQLTLASPSKTVDPLPETKKKVRVPGSLTDAKKKGKEPLRTFGELARFVELQSDEPLPPAPPADELPAESSSEAT